MTIPHYPALSRALRPATAALRAGARLVPVPVQRHGLEAALARMFAERIAAGDLDFLEGRVLGVSITDLGWRWPLTLAGGSLACLPPDARPDVTIRGRADAFLKLASRRVDPDTIFFQRDLVIEGDTELGLAAKNFLDSVDWDEWPLLRRLPALAGPGEGLRP